MAKSRMIKEKKKKNELKLETGEILIMEEVNVKTKSDVLMLNVKGVISRYCRFS